MTTKEEEAELERRFDEEWKKNWWARYALTWGKPDAANGTPAGHTEELVMLWKIRDWCKHCSEYDFFYDLLLSMSPDEREATNYLCGRIEGNTVIQYRPGVNWEESRAQNINHGDFETDREEGAPE